MDNYWNINKVRKCIKSYKKQNWNYYMEIINNENQKQGWSIIVDSKKIAVCEFIDNKINIKEFSNKEFQERYRIESVIEVPVIKENKNKHKQLEEYAKEQEVKRVRNIYNNALYGMKTKLKNGEMINAEEFEYYKDDKYSNGITRENCFLCLAEQYNIDIPSDVKEQIRNNLTRYLPRNTVIAKTGVACIQGLKEKDEIKVLPYLEKMLDKAREKQKINKDRER